MIEIDARDYDLLYKRVRQLDVEVGKQLRKRLTATAKPIVEEVRTAARRLPSRSGGEAAKWRKKKGVDAGAGLRQGLAAGAQAQVNPTRPGNFSIRIKVSSTKFAAATGKPGSLPRYVEGLTRRPWRHPVFGTDKWVVQSSTPFLLDTVLPHKHEVAEQVRKAFLDALRDLHITD